MQSRRNNKFNVPSIIIKQKELKHIGLPPNTDYQSLTLGLISTTSENVDDLTKKNTKCNL